MVAIPWLWNYQPKKAPETVGKSQTGRGKPTSSSRTKKARRKASRTR
jgi:hypothetical protein